MNDPFISPDTSMARNFTPDARPARGDDELAAHEAGILTAAMALLASYDKVVLSYSGGVDSGLLLTLLRPLRARFIVQWLNPGALPHEAEHVRKQAAGGPFFEIQSDREAAWRQHGLPTMVLPAFKAPGLAGDVPVKGQRLTANAACCATVRGFPAYQWLRANGVGLVIHGQRRGEGSDLYATDIAPAHWGPLALWTREEVISRAIHHAVPLPRQYAEGFPESFECAVCPANLDARRLAFLKRHHPPLHAETLRLARVVQNEVDRAHAWQRGVLEDAEAGGPFEKL